MSDWFIGVDGGGTRTRAVVLNERGDEIARVEGPAALADPNNPGAAAEAIGVVARSAAESAKRALPCSALWAGIAGVGREDVRRAVEAAVSGLGLARAARVGTDFEAAFSDVFSDAFGEGPGILLISGTGSAAFGRNEQGRGARVGGWGSLLGDEGSGYAIGLESLRRMARSEDGRGPTTSFSGLILAYLGLERADDLIAWAAQASKGEIAELAPLVFEAARAGDAVAHELLTHAVEELSGHLVALRDKLGPWSEPPAVALAGGLLKPGGALRPSMEEMIARQRLGLIAREPDAALGAARMARRLAQEQRSKEGPAARPL
jgi:glucosamine kinase